MITALDSLSQNNAQNEYYLTDTIALAAERELPVEAVLVDDESEVMGVNNRVELALASAEKRRQVLERLMLEGVTIIDPWATYIDSEVTIGKDTVIYPEQLYHRQHPDRRALCRSGRMPHCRQRYRQQSNGEMGFRH